MNKFLRLKATIIFIGLLFIGSIQAATPTNNVRIASPWPAQNTIITMLGYGDNIVGTSVVAKKIPLFRQILPAIEQVPVVSFAGSQELNPEQIISLGTQLLFVPDSMEIPQRELLEQAGVKILAFKANSMERMIERVLATGKELGPDAEQKALAYQQYFQLNQALVQGHLASLADEERLTVYHSMSGGLFTSGRPSLNQDWMDLAGAKNIAETWFEGKKNSGGEVPLEKIIAANPDVIVAMDRRDAQIMMDSPQWQEINAVKNNRVYVNPKGMFWWCRETSEEALQFVWLAKTLYPTRFEDVNMAEVTQDFYRDFFGVTLSMEQIEEILHP
nr:ABC transporter substrate-binding protein [uncultured Moellerella sp.]